jgi:hypothetical protein
VPAAGNVREAVVSCEFPMSPCGGLADPWNFTLCVVGPKVHRTDPPALIVTQLGANELAPVASTSAVAVAPPCTFTVTPVEVMVPLLAVIVDDPTPTPRPVFVVPVVPDSASLVASELFHPIVAN